MSLRMDIIFCFFLSTRTITERWKLIIDKSLHIAGIHHKHFRENNLIVHFYVVNINWRCLQSSTEKSRTIVSVRTYWNTSDDKYAWVKE